TDDSTKILPENVPPKTEAKLWDEHKKTVEFSLNSDCPSTAAKPEKFFKLQEKNPIFNRRSLKNTGPSIFLYDSVFGQFLNDFENQYDEKCICDGVAIIKVSRLYIGYQLFLKVKNEIGSGGSDPTIQAAIYYRDHWVQSISSPVRECCCALSFVIAVAGLWLCVLGCIFLEKVIVQPLTDLISFTINMEDYKQLEQIAQLFQALYLAVYRLKDFYKSLNLIPSEQRFFSYLNKYQTENNKTISFTYLYQFEGSLKFLWKAETIDG
ncbi:7189_t:CDS:2, partial [Funneliformis mosseae]